MADPNIQLALMQDGGLRVALGSWVKPGLQSQLVIQGARNMTEQDMRRAIVVVTMSLCTYQGKLYGDDHDMDDCIKVALSSLAEMLVDQKAAVWRNPQFFTQRKAGGGDGIVTSKIPNPARPMWT